MSLRLALVSGSLLLALLLCGCSKPAPPADTPPADQPNPNPVPTPTPNPNPATPPVPAPSEQDDWPTGAKSAPIPNDFKAVSVSRGGGRVAFVVPEGKQYRAVIDGHPEPLYDNVSIVAFSPSGKHSYYGGYRDKKWHLVRDGKEVVELGRLTNINQGTGLQLIGEPVTFTSWTPLIGAFAEEAETDQSPLQGVPASGLARSAGLLPTDAPNLSTE